jgi:hypothetical protein
MDIDSEKACSDWEHSCAHINKGDPVQQGPSISGEGGRERDASEGGKQKPTLPVAPQQASLASSISTLWMSPWPWLWPWPWASPDVSTSSAPSRRHAAKVPAMPLPTTTTSATFGSSSVVRWPRRRLDGSLCQYEDVEVGVGRGAREDWSCCVILS